MYDLIEYTELAVTKIEVLVVITARVTSPYVGMARAHAECQPRPETTNRP
jgi:hypothetical protein